MHIDVPSYNTETKIGSYVSLRITVEGYPHVRYDFYPHLGTEPFLTIRLDTGQFLFNPSEENWGYILHLALDEEFEPNARMRAVLVKISRPVKVRTDFGVRDFIVEMEEGDIYFTDELVCDKTIIKNKIHLNDVTVFRGSSEFILNKKEVYLTYTGINVAVGTNPVTSYHLQFQNTISLSRRVLYYMSNIVPSCTRPVISGDIFGDPHSFQQCYIGNFTYFKSIDGKLAFTLIEKGSYVLYNSLRTTINRMSFSKNIKWGLECKLDGLRLNQLTYTNTTSEENSLSGLMRFHSGLMKIAEGFTILGIRDGNIFLSQG